MSGTQHMLSIPADMVQKFLLATRYSAVYDLSMTTRKTFVLK
jgi:hypothetical protein